MKDKTIFIITRYSVITGGVKIADGLSTEEVKKRVFEDKRLETRFSIFSKITAPSLIAQNECSANLHFVILTAEDLPATHRQKLDAKMREIESQSSFKCIVIDVPAGDSLRKHIDKYVDSQVSGPVDHLFATVRMDDDDGLAASYCSRLCNYLDRGVVGFPISFAYGYEGIFDHVSGEFSDIRHWYYPKIALGLAFTNMYSKGKYLDKARSVYSLGSHTRIDIEHPVLIDSTFPAYFRTVSAHSDSGGYKYHDHLPKVEHGDVSADEFSYLARARFFPKKREPNTLIIPKAASSDTARLKHERRFLEGRIYELEKKLSN